jgi:hypothetical protein
MPSQSGVAAAALQMAATHGTRSESQLTVNPFIALMPMVNSG